MDILRNVSGQPIIIQRRGGATLHFLPGRAVTLSREELKSPQVQNLLQRGWVQLQELKERGGDAPKKEIERQVPKEPEAKKPSEEEPKAEAGPEEAVSEGREEGAEQAEIEPTGAKKSKEPPKMKTGSK